MVFTSRGHDDARASHTGCDVSFANLMKELEIKDSFAFIDFMRAEIRSRPANKAYLPGINQHHDEIWCYLKPVAVASKSDQLLQAAPTATDPAILQLLEKLVERDNERERQVQLLVDLGPDHSSTRTPSSASEFPYSRPSSKEESVMKARMSSRHCFSRLDSLCRANRSRMPRMDIPK